MGEQELVVGIEVPQPATRRCGGLWRTPGAPVPGSARLRCWMPVLAKVWEAAVTAEPVPSPAMQEARAQRELAEVVTAALARVPNGAAGVAVRQRVLRGPAGPVLVANADGADLLVIGHGPRVTELLHRSVTWYCVRHASCPVLVIPPAMATQGTLAPAAAEVPG